MKTYLLREAKTVEPQSNRRKPRTGAATVSEVVGRPPTRGPALFIGLDVHTQSIAVSIAPSDSTEVRRYGEIGGTGNCVSVTKPARTVIRWAVVCGRTITREDNEHLMEAMAERLKREPEKFRMRKGLAEHPFGTIKRWMGCTHFTMKGIEKVRTEWSLITLAYNLKRVLNLVSFEKLMAAVA